MIVVIGRDWANVTNPDGTRRIDDPDDHVRTEVETAIEKRKLVIPVLVSNAAMPREDELPESLKKLASLHAEPIRDVGYDADVDRLVEQIRKSRDARKRSDAAAAAREGTGSGTNTKMLAIVGGVAAIAVIGIIAVLASGGDDPGDDAGEPAVTEQVDPQTTEISSTAVSAEEPAAEPIATEPVELQEDTTTEADDEAAAAVPATGVGPQAASLDGGTYALYSAESRPLNNCLVAQGAAPPVMMPCPGDETNEWSVTEVSPEVYQLSTLMDDLDAVLCVDESKFGLEICEFENQYDLKFGMVDDTYYDFGSAADDETCAAHPIGGLGEVTLEDCSEEPNFVWVFVPVT